MYWGAQQTIVGHLNGEGDYQKESGFGFVGGRTVSSYFLIG